MASIPEKTPDTKGPVRIASQMNNHVGLETDNSVQRGAEDMTAT